MDDVEPDGEDGVFGVCVVGKKRKKSPPLVHSWQQEVYKRTKRRAKEVMSPSWLGNGW